MTKSRRHMRRHRFHGWDPIQHNEIQAQRKRYRDVERAARRAARSFRLLSRAFKRFLATFRITIPRGHPTTLAIQDETRQVRT